MRNPLRLVLKRLPVGFAASPFEFVFMASYALVSGKYLLDIATGGQKRDLASLAAIPLHGTDLTTWLIILFASTICACLGLLVIGYHTVLGLRLERSGLCGAAAMIGFYIFELYSVIGFSFGIGFVTILGLLCAMVYKIVLIGQTLDALTERRH